MMNYIVRNDSIENLKQRGGDMEKEILSIEEAAKYLQLGKRSIYKLCQSGKIPHRKILNKYRFERETLREWVKNTVKVEI
jgi:excisionase family DNA binding protein